MGPRFGGCKPRTLAPERNCILDTKITDAELEPWVRQKAANFCRAPGSSSSGILDKLIGLVRVTSAQYLGAKRLCAA